MDVTGKRLASVQSERCSKGHAYIAEDVCRRQVMCVSQKMVNLQAAIEETCNEQYALASLFESATMKLRKGRTGSFKVHRVAPKDLPCFLNERGCQYGRVLVAASNPSCWQVQTAAPTLAQAALAVTV